MKKIKGYDGYFITRDGRVLSSKDGKKFRELHTYIVAGYECVGLSKDGKQHLEYVHRLLGKAFIPNPDDKPCINHIDGNKTNNSLTNLEWCSYQENMLHAYNVLKIKDYPKYKEMLMKNEEKKIIRKKFKQQKKKAREIRCIETGETFKSQCEAARHFGVSHSMINLAIHNHIAVKQKYHFEYATT